MMQSAFSCFARDRTLELTGPRKLQEAVCWLERGSARGRQVCFLYSRIYSECDDLISYCSNRFVGEISLTLPHRTLSGSTRISESQLSGSSAW